MPGSAKISVPSMGGALFTTGMLAAPLVACVVLKISCAIWQAFRKHRLPE